MLRLVTTCMLVYYALGVFLLGGVFVRLMHLPEMYAHCKATEEADMDLWDFLEDHVTCFGAVFEVPEADDEDLPHASDEDYVAPTPVTAPDAWPRSFTCIDPGSSIIRLERCSQYVYEPITDIFHPPAGMPSA